MKRAFLCLLFFILFFYLGFWGNYSEKPLDIKYLDEKEPFHEEDVTYIAGYEKEGEYYIPINNDPQIDFNNLNYYIAAIQISLREKVERNTLVQVYYAKPEEGLQESNSVKSYIKEGERQFYVDIPGNLYREIRIDINGKFSLDTVYWSESPVQCLKSIEFVDYFFAFLFAVSLTVFLWCIISYLEHFLEEKGLKREDIHRKIPAIAIRTIFFIISLLLLILVLFFSGRQYMCKRVFSISNVAIFGSTIIVVTLTAFLMGQTSRKWDFVFCLDKTVKKMAFCLFLGQVYISYNILFYAGWDVDVIVTAAKTLAYGDVSNLNNTYFSRYPNNLLLTIIEGGIFRLNNKIGIFDGEHELMAVVLVNCILNSCTCYMIYHVCKYIISEKFAFVGFFFGILTVGISPWMTICYSDAMGLIFPILILYIYMRPFKKRVWGRLRYVIVVLLSIMGYLIKPQAIIVFIAIFGIEIFFSMWWKEMRRTAFFVGGVIFAVFSLVLTQEVMDRGYEKVGFEINKEAAFEWQHYFMMGMNGNRNGVYAEEDVVLSASLQSAKERKKINLEMAKNRLKEFGLTGFLKHIAKKMLTTYNDGTYAWWMEGNFCFPYKEPNSVMAQFMRSIYYQNGKHFMKFITLEQISWLAVLAFCVLSVFLRTTEDKDKYIAVVMLSLMGLTLYEVLFEVRARYLYTYIPFFCILGSCGIHIYYQKVMGWARIIDKVRSGGRRVLDGE